MITLLMLLACASSPAPEATPASPPAAEAAETEAAPERGTLTEIDVKELHGLLESSDDIVLIDVRTDAEYERGHVPGTVHIPMEVLMSSTEALAPYAGKPVHLICQSGGRSARVAQRITQDGYDAVNVAGGTMAWQSAGYPVE